jgi:drug/metabolite transporter (DMT)-like permease
VLFAGLLGFLILGEVPVPMFYLAAVLIVLGALVALGPVLREPRGATE